MFAGAQLGITVSSILLGRLGEAAIADRLFHQGLGAISGTIEAQGRQGVYLAVDLGDALLQHVEQIERGNLA